MKMKKAVTGLLAAALVVAMATTGALAADWSGRRTAAVERTVAVTAAGETAQAYVPRCHYLDVDGDGVYDYCVGPVNPWVDTDGDGVYDARLTAAEPYLDTDGDGVYDYYVGRAYAFADADGDGVYDYYDGAACPFVDADGDGVCDGCGQYLGRGPGFCGDYCGENGYGYCYEYGGCYADGYGCYADGYGSCNGGWGGCGRRGYYGAYSGSTASGAAGVSGAVSVNYGHRGGCRR